MRHVENLFPVYAPCDNGAYVSEVCVLQRIAGGCIVLKACTALCSMVQYGSVA